MPLVDNETSTFVAIGKLKVSAGMEEILLPTKLSLCRWEKLETWILILQVAN